MMLHCGSGVLAALALAMLVAAQSSSAAAVVEHSLDGKTFQRIGLIHLEDDLQGTQPVVTGSYERQPVTDNQIAQLKQLVENDRLYLWRVKLEGQPPVLTSIKAACLAEHLLTHSPILSLDTAGSIISAQLAVPQTPDGTCSTSRALQQLQQPPEELTEPHTLKVVVKTPAAAPGVPKGPAGVEGVNLMTAGAAGQQQQQQPQQAPGQGAAGSQQQGGQTGGGQQAGGAEGEKAPPPPDTRTWWQKNWLFVMAGGTMVLNMALKAAVGDAPPAGQQGGRPGGVVRAAGGTGRR